MTEKPQSTTTEAPARQARKPERLSAELRAFQRRFKRGYRWERTGGGDHVRLVDPHGRMVEHNGMNITAGMNPSPRSIRALESQLNEAQVFSGTGERKPSDEAIEFRKERLREMLRTQTRVRTEQTEAIRARLKNHFEKIGGFDHPGLAPDLAQVADRLFHDDLRKEGVTPDLLVGNARRFLNGSPIEPRYQRIWDRLADHLERVTDPIGEWYTLLREARGLPRAAVQVRLPDDAADQWPFRVELLPLEALLADPAYQRPVNWPFVRREAARFDPSLVGTIDVAQRSPSQFALLDGQQRSEIVRLVSKNTIFASIYEGLDLASEARFFLHKNRDRKTVHPWYVYKAMVAAQDPDALGVEAIMKDYGYKVESGAPNESRPSSVSAIGSILAAYTQKLPDGTPSLAPTMRILKASTYGMPKGQDAVLIRGLAGALVERPTFDEQALIDTLIDLSPRVILERALDVRRVGLNYTKAVTQVLVTEGTKRERSRKRSAR